MSLLSYQLIIFFSLGYLGIIFEKFLKMNKAAVALLLAAGCWLLYFSQTPTSQIPHELLTEQISGLAQIIFFLIAAMAIVEIIDSHQGFKLITEILYTSSKRKMLWFLLGISFFMSAVLDNLTSMIVMTSLIRKLVKNKQDRWLLGSMVVIAVNAGGAWTPIGDVTTTMLWIGGKITTWQTMKMLFLPSLVCTVVAGFLALFMLRKSKQDFETVIGHKPLEPWGKTVFIFGVLALVMIPVWKALFGLPPFLGALIGLGVLWLVTDIVHTSHGDERMHLRVPHVLSRIDTSGVMFFLGILLAISALETGGILDKFAAFLNEHIPNEKMIAVVIGLISSIIDNVPLVAASMGMYDIQTYAQDSQFWQLIAYAAGTGGSILIIGSAAGVAFMGMEKVDFLWYLKNISWIALIGYFAGILMYLVQTWI